MEDIQRLLTTNRIFSYEREGILVAQVADSDKGLEITQEILYTMLTKQTFLLLSGGRTPKELYSALSRGQTLDVGAAGLIDERFGTKMHENSNERMLKETGLLRFLDLQQIPFYPILQNNMDRLETAEKYDEQLRSLFAVYKKSVGVLGIGVDGHTAGIPAKNTKFETLNSKFDDGYSLVAEYDDKDGFYKERVTMTSLGLSMLDLLIVLVFGEDKKRALELVFDNGSEEEIPGRFYKRPEIARKTIFITDQNV